VYRLFTLTGKNVIVTHERIMNNQMNG